MLNMHHVKLISWLEYNQNDCLPVICYYECMYFSTLCIEPKGIHVFLTIVTLVMVSHACMHILHY